MFDVGFTELVLLFVIGLLILGPERLPRVATQLGRWMGKARRTAHQLRMQMEREMTMNDIMRDQKKREQEDKTSGAASSSASDDNREYPEEEDANDSGHGDAGADAPESSSAATEDAGTPSDGETKEQRTA